MSQATTYTPPNILYGNKTLEIERFLALPKRMPLKKVSKKRPRENSEDPSICPKVKKQPKLSQDPYDLETEALYRITPVDTDFLTPDAHLFSTCEKLDSVVPSDYWKVNVAKLFDDECDKNVFVDAVLSYDDDGFHRGVVVEWLFEVEGEYGLGEGVAACAVDIFDRYVGVSTVPVRNLQLTGIACLEIALNFCFSRSMTSNEWFIDLCAGARNDEGEVYHPRHMIQLKKNIMSKLEYKVDFINPHHFLELFIEASSKELFTEEIELCRGMIDYFSISHNSLFFKPSEIAASAIYIVSSAACDQHISLWKTEYKQISYNKEELLACSKKVFQHFNPYGKILKYSSRGKEIFYLINQMKL